MTLPAPLPSYYSEALRVDGFPLIFTRQEEKDGVESFTYSRVFGQLSVRIDYLPCEESGCDGLFEGGFQTNRARLTEKNGEFLSIKPTEFVGEWDADGFGYLVLVARVPKAIVGWTLSMADDQDFNIEIFLEKVRFALDRQRYEEASLGGNVDLGRWAEAMHSYGLGLLEKGEMQAGLRALKKAVTLSPSHFDSQMDFAERTSDEKAARGSALAVWDSSEDPLLTERAGVLLGRTVPSLDSLPVLEGNPQGLQLVLVPLPPCDTRLVQAAGKLYAENLDIPVSVRRLPQDWHWDDPDRFFGQRVVEKIIQAKAEEPVDFTGWSRGRYALELTPLLTQGDALERYRVRELWKNSSERAGQYSAEKYAERFVRRLEPYRSGDKRTMFVGVTAADIFLANKNFVFSGGRRDRHGSASILSYSRMTTEMSREPFESRQRVAERMAKELVPASFNQLGISRPVDPTDPFSYSSGLDRVDQKSLTLSESTREALDRLRTP
jgi:predicted Zn-dependent protease